jgi:hypothetical protein
MATPSLPWYPKLKKIVAPTEGVTNLVLIAIVIITLVILWKGDALKKALWAVYLVSP